MMVSKYIVIENICIQVLINNVIKPFLVPNGSAGRPSTPALVGSAPHRHEAAAASCLRAGHGKFRSSTDRRLGSSYICARTHIWLGRLWWRWKLGSA